jgi:hypothetical protein
MIYLVGLAALFIGLCIAVILLGLALLDDDEPASDATDIAGVTVTPTSAFGATDVPAPATATEFPGVSPVNPPTVLPTAAATEFPAFSATAQPTAIPTQAPTEAISGEAVLLMVVAYRANSAFYIINTGDVPFPLSTLLINYKNTSFEGSEWAGVVLETGQCVRAWNDNEYRKGDFAEKEDEALSDLPECLLPVGPVVTREGREQFWQEDFTVLINNEEKVNCEKGKKGKNNNSQCEVRWQ